MKQQQLWQILLVTGFVWLGVAMKATAGPVLSLEVQSKSVSRILRDSPPTSNLSRLSELERPVTSAQMLVQSPVPATVPKPEIVQVTGVKANPINKGVEVILQTTLGQQLQVVNRSAGNSYIADIPNAQLRLPNGEAFIFRSEKPITGITEITVTNADANTIRVTVTGEAGVPTVELFDSSDEGLIFGVVSAAVATPPQQQPETQPTPEPVESGSETAEPDEPAAEGEEIEVLVTGEQETGYRVPNASTATRTDTPLRDIPQSIQVVPRQVIEAQGVTQLRDALENVSGVTRDGNFGGTGSGSFVIRGFTQEGNFRDGFRDNDFYSIAETANIDRIEVLRGPASVLFGQAQPGGIINLVTKQPLREPYYEFSFSGGSYEFYRPALDLSGPITSDGSLRYRLNVVYQNSDSFRDFVNTERFFIAPVLAWDISEYTTLTLNFEYLYDNPLYDRGLTALSDGSLPLPIERFLGYPSLDDYTAEVYRSGYNLEHRFSDDWQIRNALSIYSSRSGGGNVDINGDLIDDRLLPRELRDDNFVNENYALQTELTGRFNTGSIRHQVLLGVELNRRTSWYDSFTADLPPIDIFTPNYNVSRPTELSNTYNQIIFTDTIGIYLQDQIDLFDNLKLLAGGRLDFVEQDETFPYTGTSNIQSSDAFSPRLGIVYQPSEEVSLYASYSRSFFPVVGRSADNSPFSPERGTQYEVGIKADFLDGALSATLAAYDITKANVLTTDRNNTDFSVQVGEQRSRGVDFNIAGEILPGWNIIAGYAYTDARVTEDNTIPEGDFLQNVAENTANLWTTYEIQGGALRGLGFGLGLFFVGERQGDFLPNTNFQLPSYFRTDAAIFYRRNRFAAALNIRNLFDTKYYETAQGRNIVYPGAPFSVQGTISYEF